MKKTISTTILIMACILFEGCITIKASQTDRNMYGQTQTTDDCTTRSVKMSNVTEVTSSAVTDIIYRQGRNCTVELKGSSCNLNRIIIETEGSRLIIKEKDKNKKDKNKSDNVTVFITAPSLEHISFSGVGDISMPEEVKLHTFSCTHKGVGHIRLNDLTCDNVSVDAKGVGDVNINGHVRQTTSITHSGVGNINLNVHTDKLIIRSQGVGDVNLSGKAANYDISNNKVGKLNTSDLSR